MGGQPGPLKKEDPTGIHWRSPTSGNAKYRVTRVLEPAPDQRRPAQTRRGFCRVVTGLHLCGRRGKPEGRGSASVSFLLPTAPSAIMTRLKPMIVAVSTRSRPAQTTIGFHQRGTTCHQVRPRRTNSRPAFPSPRFHFIPGAGLF